MEVRRESFFLIHLPKVSHMNTNCQCLRYKEFCRISSTLQTMWLLFVAVFIFFENGNISSEYFIFLSFGILRCLHRIFVEFIIHRDSIILMNMLSNRTQMRWLNRFCYLCHFVLRNDTYFLWNVWKKCICCDNNISYIVSLCCCCCCKCPDYHDRRLMHFTELVYMMKTPYYHRRQLPIDKLSMTSTFFFLPKSSLSVP